MGVYIAAYQGWSWINDTWKARTQLKPNDALAITNTFFNIALAIAIANGVAIAWWRRALRGATVAELHRSWAFSNNVLDLLTAGKYFNLIALAALTAKLALADNILLQRATGTGPGIFTQEFDNIRLPIVAQLPENYAGTFNPESDSVVLSGNFSQDLWTNMEGGSGTIQFNSIWNDDGHFETNCRGTCIGFVRGFGFKVNCTRTETIESFMNHTSMSNTTSLSELPLFKVRAQGLSAGEEITPPGQRNISFPYDVIALTLERTNTWAAPGFDDWRQANACEVEERHRMCFLQPAVLNYPIQITNVTNNELAVGGVSLIDNPNMSSDNESDYYYGYRKIQNGQIQGIDVVEPLTENQTSNVYAIALAMNDLYESDSVFKYSPETGYTTSDSGNLAALWLASQNLRRPSSSCVIDIPDPLNFLMTQLNQLTLRMSISGAIETRYNETAEHIYYVPIQSRVVTFSTNSTIDTIWYTSNYAYMGPAVGIMVLCILGVLPIYYGFWELGRKVTLGPVEIASAFQAPILEHPAAAGRGEVDEVLRQVGSRRLRYGEVEGTGRLGIAEPEAVRDIGSAQ